MAVHDKIEVTPPFTFSTIQFEDEIVNTIVLSLIAVLILTNIGSVVTKLVYFTREKRFNYNSFLRAFIFANSDDPVRIIGWISKAYVYRQRHWHRNPQRYRPGRLFLPLFARFAILVCSIASIAITVPGEKQLTGCERGDYALRIDPAEARGSPIRPQGVCVNVPMTTRRGSVRSAVSYCDCPIDASIDSIGSAVLVTHDVDVGEMRVVVVSNRTIRGKKIYVEWKPKLDSKRTFRTNLRRTISARDVAVVAVRAICNRLSSCEVLRTNELEDGFFILVSPLFNPTQKIEEVSSFIRSSLFWVRTERAQRRIVFNGATRDDELTDDCPIDIRITRPIVNIVPLSIVMVVWCGINILVSIAVMKHSNAFDAGFHLVKEALGHDTTSNPFEMASDRDEIMAVELRKWLCTTHCGNDTGGHVGFIGRAGDIPLAKDADFDDGLIVGECSRAEVELARARDLANSPAYASPSSVQAAPPLGGTPPATATLPANTSTAGYGAPVVGGDGTSRPWQP